MKSKLKLRSIACLLFFATAVLNSQPVVAHFLWIIPPESGSNKFSVVFSEGLQPDDPAMLERLQSLKVMLYDADGNSQQVPVKLEEDRLVGTIPDDFLAIAIDCSHVWGMFSRGAAEFLLKYRAMSLLDPTAAERIEFAQTEADGPLIRVRRSPQAMSVVAFYQGKPLAKESVKVQGHGSSELILDDSGSASWNPEKSGNYALMVKATQESSGQWDGKPYKQIRHYTTLSVPLDSQVSDPEPKSEFPALPQTVTSFGAARCGDALYVFGGHTGTAHSYSNDGQARDLLKLDLHHLAAGWQKVAKSTSLQGLGMVAYGEKLILVGGFNAKNPKDEEHDLHSTDAVSVYDTESGKWSSLPSLPEPRSSHDAALIGDTLYVVGGWQLNSPNESTWHSTAWSLNLADVAAKWEPITQPPFERRALALMEHHDKLFVIGGMNRDGGPTMDVEVYDPANKVWADGPALIGTKPLAGFGAAAIEVDDKLVVTTMEGNIEVLSPDESSWKVIGESKDGRFFHRTLPLDSGRIISIGGANMEVGKFDVPEAINVR